MLDTDMTPPTTCKYSVSLKSGAIGKLCCMAIYMENIKRESCCISCAFNLKCWNFLPRMSHYGATLFISSAVKSYGDVATLTWQFTSRGFPGFVHFVFLVVPMSPSM
jgi:hypothetical protein